MSEHAIDHNDLTTRTWVCTKCGCRCLSKNPWQRNTHGETSGGITQAMYMSALRNVSTARMGEAYPPRPKDKAFVYLRSTDKVERDAAFCLTQREQDIHLFIDPGNGDVDDTGQPLETPAQALLRFFKMIREAEWETVQGYVCAELGGGHAWTDDPALVSPQE